MERKQFDKFYFERSRKERAEDRLEHYIGCYMYAGKDLEKPVSETDEYKTLFKEFNDACEDLWKKLDGGQS